MLGVSGTFLSLLNTLSIAEMGFESAIIFSLYKPIKDGSKREIEDVISILKRIYQFVGLFVLIAGIVISFFLSKILSGIEINLTIYTTYYFSLFGSVFSYFFAHKGTFLLAQQRDFIRSLYTSGYKILFALIQIILIINFQSFEIFVFFSVAQNLLTSYAIFVYVGKNYDYNFNQKINLQILKKIIKDVKEIFIGKIAGYVYSSTDNLIISMFINTLSVGLLGNYTQILFQLKAIINNIFISTRPIIGHFLTTNENRSHTYQILKNYTFLRHSLVVLIFVPSFVLCNPFVSLWLGEKYVLPQSIALLIVSDIFIHFVHGALVDYISGLGYFAQDRKISIIGAVLNILISLVLVSSMGILGVLIGTLVSQIFFWILRSVIVFRTYFDDITNKFLNYWFFNFIYLALFYLLCFLNWWIYNEIPIENSYLKLSIGAILISFVNAAIIIVIYRRTKELKYFLSIMKNFKFN